MLLSYVMYVRTHDGIINLCQISKHLNILSVVSSDQLRVKLSSRLDRVSSLTVAITDFDVNFYLFFR